MRRNILFYLLPLFIGVWLSSCSDKEAIQEICDDVEIQTRALSGGREFYYYYKGEKVPIEVNTNKRYVLVRKSEEQLLSSRAQVYSTSDNAIGYIVDVYNDTVMTTYSCATGLNTLYENENILAVEYVIGDSILVPLSNKFYVKLKKSSDIALLEREATLIGCQIEKKLESDDLWIRLRSTRESAMNSLEASNYLYETGLFEDIDPGFLWSFQTNSAPSDPYYASQWGLKDRYGIHAEGAWNITKGSSAVTVAVVDGGIYAQHPDLAGRMHSYAYNCVDKSNSPQYSNHGTMCAGIIAANHNNIAIAGVAPNVRLMDIYCMLNHNRPNIIDELSDGITKAWQNGADVINNSWGDQGGAFYSYLHSAVLENAIRDALTKGRNGKGCVVCFASGNHEVLDYPAYCNPDIMVVGSIGSDGTVPIGSGRGEELDVVAPGERIISLAVGGGIGVDSGTSYASPYAAGIAALILSEHPDLTQQQVCTVIKETASSKTWNKTMGWGAVNAERALQVLAGDFSIVSEWGSNAFIVSKFYIPDLPKSAKVQWSTAKNIAKVVKNTGDTVVYSYNFVGKYMTDEIKATITYCDKVFNRVFPVTIFNEPRITGVERIIYYSEDEYRIDLQVNCTDPDAQFTWSGSNDFVDFPYLGDAGFMDYPNRYKSIYIYGNGTYNLSVRADNRYASDIYDFQIIKSAFGIEIREGNNLRTIIKTIK